MRLMTFCTVGLLLSWGVLAQGQPAPGVTAEDEAQAARPDASSPAEHAPTPPNAAPPTGSGPTPASAEPAASAAVPSVAPATELKPPSAPSQPEQPPQTPADLKQPTPTSPPNATRPAPPAAQPSAAPPLLANTEAPAEQVDSMDDIEAPYTGPLGSHQTHLFAWIGVRNDYVRDDRYDIFADNDALPAFSLGAGGVLFAVDRLSVAALGSWEAGSYEAEVRGDETDLLLHRLAVGGEARYHLAYRWYVFTRASVGPTYARAMLDNRVARSNWIAKRWLVSAALSAGTAWRLLGSESGARRMPRMWINAEAGYGISSKLPLEFETDAGDASAPERGQAQDLGDLSLNAPFFRLALAGSY